MSPLHPPQYDLNPTNIIDTTTAPLPAIEETIKPAPVVLEGRIEEAKNEADESASNEKLAAAADSEAKQDDAALAPIESKREEEEG